MYFINAEITQLLKGFELDKLVEKQVINSFLLSVNYLTLKQYLSNQKQWYQHLRSHLSHSTVTVSSVHHHCIVIPVMFRVSLKPILACTWTKAWRLYTMNIVLQSRKTHVNERKQKLCLIKTCTVIHPRSSVHSYLFVLGGRLVYLFGWTSLVDRL